MVKSALLIRDTTLYQNTSRLKAQQTLHNTPLVLGSLSYFETRKGQIIRICQNPFFKTWSDQSYVYNMQPLDFYISGKTHPDIQYDTGTIDQKTFFFFK